MLRPSSEYPAGVGECARQDHKRPGGPIFGVNTSLDAHVIHAAGEQGELKEIAAVQRKFANPGGIDDRSDGVGCGAQLFRRRGRNGHGSLDASNLQRNGDGGLLTHFDSEAGHLLRAESRHLHPDGVVSRKHRDEKEGAVLRRLGFPDQPLGVSVMVTLAPAISRSEGSRTTPPTLQRQAWSGRQADCRRAAR